ncbi:hypothetical protein PtB15_4B866 [Puccinia triticina]|nr:hypothetical protein PtB15_4B866 [Puccinia triticina]
MSQRRPALRANGARPQSFPYTAKPQGKEVDHFNITIHHEPQTHNPKEKTKHGRRQAATPVIPSPTTQPRKRTPALRRWRSDDVAPPRRRLPTSIDTFRAKSS